jgi:hypothetical protein
MSHEEKLIQQIKEAQQDYQDVSGEIKIAKAKIVEMEDRLIEISIRREKLLNALEDYRNITVSKIVPEKDQYLEEFRKRNPELMEYIRNRDHK